jgi:hypothetical protein
MAAGSAFTLAPDEVIILDPDYHNVITPSESMKKDYQNLSTTPVEQYRLKFKALTSVEKDTILNHYKDQYGGYHSFSWQSVPTYVGSGANITGRWVQGSLDIKSRTVVWTCDILFEKDN